MTEFIDQSILIPKQWGTVQQAKQWIADHGYKTTFGGKEADITDQYYRFRQNEPNPHLRYATIQISPEGIKKILQIIPNQKNKRRKRKYAQ